MGAWPHPPPWSWSCSLEAAAQGAGSPALASPPASASPPLPLLLGPNKSQQGGGGRKGRGAWWQHLLLPLGPENSQKAGELGGKRVAHGLTHSSSTMGWRLQLLHVSFLPSPAPRRQWHCRVEHWGGEAGTQGQRQSRGSTRGWVMVLCYPPPPLPPALSFLMDNWLLRHKISHTHMERESVNQLPVLITNY